jgi:hypothetical protein
MRRISGVDINGWRDVAARDWDAEEPDVELDVAKIIDGGFGTVAVRQRSGEWIAGPQAFVAPHGRGHGWGELGDPERRVSLAPFLNDPLALKTTAGKAVYCATVNALARGAEDILLSVPDTPQFDEAAQYLRLSIFQRDKRKIRLLWRPVAAFLHALNSRDIPLDSEGDLFCFLIHSNKGLELQTLRLRRDAEHPSHLAPERDDYGMLVLPDLGIDQLANRAHARVLRANPHMSEGSCEKSTLGLQLLFNPGSVTTEVLRLNNGNWTEAAPPSLTEDDVFLRTDFHSGVDFGTSDPITATFLLTPLIEPFASALATRLRSLFPNLVRLGWDGVARGTLRAGRLIERGLPHYFDRLTPISLAVMKRDEPQFDDLIGSKATLPANKEYVSPPYRDLKWLAGKNEIEFYVLKGDSEVRFWKITLNDAPRTDVEVELRIRQTPGQSWAKLSLTSPEWEPLQRAPIMLDWTKLAPLDVSPEDILEKLRTPPPTVPIRIVEAPLIDFWVGTDRIKGLNSLVAQMHHAGRYDLVTLARMLSRSQRHPTTQHVVRPIGTDGELPEELSEQVVDHLTLALERSYKLIAASSRQPLLDNAPIRCLTWTFTRCPQDIQDMIVEALDADLAGRRHPLLAPRAARKVVILGAGRSVTAVQRIGRVLRSLVSRPASADTMNAIAMILSRRAEAPHALTGPLVEDIVRLTSAELTSLTERLSFLARFKYALSAIAGLFRYREVEPFALLAARDPAARKLRDSLENTSELMARNRNKVSRIDEKLGLISSIRDLLEGGGDPAILVRIEDLDDDDSEVEE